jgi:hypothetical protein
LRQGLERRLRSGVTRQASDYKVPKWVELLDKKISDVAKNDHRS